MFVCNYINQIVKINRNDYSSEKQFYIALWKIKYNINIAKNTEKFNIIDYII